MLTVTQARKQYRPIFAGVLSNVSDGHQQNSYGTSVPVYRSPDAPGTPTLVLRPGKRTDKPGNRAYWLIREGKRMTAEDVSAMGLVPTSLVYFHHYGPNGWHTESGTLA